MINVLDIKQTTNLIKDFIKDIRNAGGEIYIVGGAVRNYLYNYFHLTNISIKDYDFLVRLLNENIIINILQKYSINKNIESSFGVITLNYNYKKFEFALPRKYIYNDFNKDFTLSCDVNLTIEEDLKSRDATINTIALPIYSLTDLELLDIKKNNAPQFEKFIDLFGGISDIKNKIWKGVDNPLDRFLEDPSRIMRAFKLSQELDLIIEANTLKVIKSNSNLIKKILPQSDDEIYKLSSKYLELEY